MKVIEKLSTYAALIGVIGAIGGGFYTWGQFNLRLDQIENKEFVVNETVDLSPMEEKISTLKVELIDRIDEVEEQIKPVANVEPFVPREMNEEDRKLVEKMTSILDSSTKDLLEGEDE